MAISPFSFRELGEVIADDTAEAVSAAPKKFLPQQVSRKKEVAPPPPPPPPTFSESDLKSAERDGYQRGFLDGVTEGKNMAHSEQEKVDLALTQVVESFVQFVDPLFSTYREMLKQVGQQVPPLAQAIAKKVASCALEEKAYQVIEELSLRCISTLYHEPQMVITVHESLSSTLTTKIADARKKMQTVGEIHVVGDTTINLANCRIEWKNGSMVRDTDSLWQQIESVINSMIETNERDAEALANALESALAQPLTPPAPQPPEGE